MTMTATCDACRRKNQRCEKVTQGGMRLRVCVAWRSCIAAQPTLDVLLDRTPAGAA